MTQIPLKHVIIFLLFLISLITLLLVILLPRIPYNSFILKTFNPSLSFNSPVTSFCIVHTIAFTFPVFTTQTFSHWNLGLWDSNSNFFMLSNAYKYSVLIYSFPSSTIQKISSPTPLYTFTDNDNYRYIIRLDEIFTPTSTLTVSDCISLYHSITKSSCFNIYTTNCQYFTYQFLKSYSSLSSTNFPPPKTGFIHVITQIVSELNSSIIPKYHQNKTNVFRRLLFDDQVTD